jgi:xylulokinase
MTYVIGVDVGSQSVKAVLVSSAGKELASASSACTMQYPASGWAEQEPAQWTDGLTSCIGQLIRDSGVKATQISHLAMACQVDGVVATSREGKALRSAIIWLDRRASTETEQFGQAAGGGARVFQRTGLNLDSSHTAPKIMWIMAHEPRVAEATAWMLPAGAYLLHWLTGEVLQDPANASSSLLYDVGTGDWSDDLIAASGIDRSWLAPLSPSHAVAGGLTPAAASRLGLSTSCLVTVGTGDEHAATLGAGAIAPGIVVDVTGTAEPVTTVSDTAVFDGQGLLETHAHSVAGKLLIENPGFVSGGSTRWHSETLGGGMTQGDLIKLAGKAPAGSDGVIFIPALSGAMTPTWNDAMRGAFTGLAMNHDNTFLARAVVEGCTYALRDIVDRIDEMGLASKEIRVVGGGARSELWLQIKADVTGRAVRPVETQEATALGAAMLAGLAAGHFTTFAESVAACVPLSSRLYEPDPAAAQVYAERYSHYRAVYSALEGTLR